MYNILLFCKVRSNPRQKGFRCTVVEKEDFVSAASLELFSCDSDAFFAEGEILIQSRVV